MSLKRPSRRRKRLDDEAVLPAYTKVFVSIWEDERFLGLSGAGREMFLFFLSCKEARTLPGLLRMSPALIAARLRWRTAKATKALAELSAAGLVRTDERGVIWLPNAMRYNVPDAPNNVISWVKEMRAIGIAESQLGIDAVRSIAAHLLATKGQHYAEPIFRSFGKIADLSECGFATTFSTPSSTASGTPSATTFSTPSSTASGTPDQRSEIRDQRSDPEHAGASAAPDEDEDDDTDEDDEIPTGGEVDLWGKPVLSAKQSRAADVKRVLEAYLRRSPEAKPGKNERRMIRTRLESRSADELIEAIEGAHQDDWTIRTSNTVIRYILKDDGQITKYIKIARRMRAPPTNAKTADPHHLKL